MVAQFLQLLGQIRQFSGMGAVVAHHIAHQRHQFFHRRMLALGSTALAGAGAAVVMVVVVMIMMVVIVMMFVMMMVMHRLYPPFSVL